MKTLLALAVLTAGLPAALALLLVTGTASRTNAVPHAAPVPRQS